MLGGADRSYCLGSIVDVVNGAFDASGPQLKLRYGGDERHFGLGCVLEGLEFGIPREVHTNQFPHVFFQLLFASIVGVHAKKWAKKDLSEGTRGGDVDEDIGFSKEIHEHGVVTF